MPKSPKWKYYVLKWNQGPIYEFLKYSYLNWPNIQFETLADKIGFDRLKPDQTLIGGHFANSNGDCLVCVPVELDVRNIY